MSRIRGVRLALLLPQNAADLLGHEAQQRQCSISEAVRQAIVVAAQVHEVWRTGGKVLLESPSGQVRELPDMDMVPVVTPATVADGAVGSADPDVAQCPVVLRPGLAAALAEVERATTSATTTTALAKLEPVAVLAACPECEAARWDACLHMHPVRRARGDRLGRPHRSRIHAGLASRGVSAAAGSVGRFRLWRVDSR